MKKYAIITFDYEVFLGRKTGTIENCVIRPTNAILEILKKNNAKAIFFVDTTWLLFLKENFFSDFMLVAGQLKRITELGSSVELHLHPQWIDAYKSETHIGFNSYRYYKLHSLNQIEISDLFNKSIELLQGITNQKICCFRAGGWCIQPFDQLCDVFKSCLIEYDFSVVPGLSLNDGKDYDFDFSNAPELPFYRFNNNINQPDTNGPFVEFPLSTYHNNPIYRIFNKVILKIIKDSIFGDGMGSKGRSTNQTFTHVFSFSKEKFSLDRINTLLFRYLLYTHLRKSSLIVVVSHPKLVSACALNNLDYITKKYRTMNSTEFDNYIQLK
jgi:hypothetical protein